MRRPRSSIRAQKEEPIESVLGMTRSYLVFGDIEGKLDVLRVECTKCDRKGRYHPKEQVRNIPPIWDVGSMPDATRF